MHPTRALRNLVGFLALIAASSLAVFAQTGATAQLSGVVTDPSGALVAGAAVTARNIETGLKRQVSTSDEGQYLLTDLLPGLYELTAEASGFARPRPIPFEFTVGQQATRNLSLSLAGTTQAITVTAGVDLIESSRTEQSQAIEERRIANLPINGRRFLDFILLLPMSMSGAAISRTRRVRASPIKRTSRLPAWMKSHPSSPSTGRTR